MEQSLEIIKRNMPIIEEVQQKIIELEPAAKDIYTRIRPEKQRNKYIESSIKLFLLGEYRNAMDNIWQATIDDIREKVLARSITFFNQEMKTSISKYSDFQDKKIQDNDLIEGAYKIDIYDFETKEKLHINRNIRNKFLDHPKRSRQ